MDAIGRVKLSLLDLPLRRDELLELIPPELRRKPDQGRRTAFPSRCFCRTSVMTALPPEWPTCRRWFSAI